MLSNWNSLLRGDTALPLTGSRSRLSTTTCAIPSPSIFCVRTAIQHRFIDAGTAENRLPSGSRGTISLLYSNVIVFPPSSCSVYFSFMPDPVATGSIHCNLYYHLGRDGRALFASTVTPAVMMYSCLGGLKRKWLVLVCGTAVSYR